MESKLSIHSPQQVPSVHSFARRRRDQERKSGKTFELDAAGTNQPPDVEEIDIPRPGDRSVTPPESDEAGARLDITA